MRHFTRLTLSLILILGVSAVLTTTQAQQTKLAHINVSELLQMMPGIKSADQKLQKYAEQLEQQSQNMLSEYQSKVKNYEEKKALMADAVKEVKQEEISDMEQRIQSFRQTAQQKLMKKKEELYGPILKKAENAIQDVAKENGYAYVFDSSAGGIVYARDSDDIMPLVKQKLGL